MNIRIFGIATVFALALTACPSSTTPTASSVTVTTPVSNALKINEAVQFNAIAKDSGNTEIVGKTFAWVSSDPNVASVDANGSVTAKRFGTVTITASTDGINGTSSTQTTFGLEAIGGTKISTANTQIGTAFLARFRKPGTPLSGTVSATLKGPAGWNEDKTLDLNFYLYNGFVLGTWRSSIEAKSGDYTLEMTANGELFKSSFEIDASQTLTSPASLTLPKVSATSVTGAWSAVSGASGYFFYVYDFINNKIVLDSVVYTTDTTATASGKTALDSTKPAKTYAAFVEAYTIAPTGGDVNAPAFIATLPKQFNVAVQGVYLGAFSAAATTPLQPQTRTAMNHLLIDDLRLNSSR
jgi:Bacterial Ig-like domain (group 2)